MPEWIRTVYRLFLKHKVSAKEIMVYPAANPGYGFDNHHLILKRNIIPDEPLGDDFYRTNHLQEFIDGLNDE